MPVFEACFRSSSFMVSTHEVRTATRSVQNGTILERKFHPSLRHYAASKA
jgi:hypothetical protein